MSIKWSKRYLNVKIGEMRHCAIKFLLLTLILKTLISADCQHMVPLCCRSIFYFHILQCEIEYPPKKAGFYFIIRNWLDCKKLVLFLFKMHKFVSIHNFQVFFTFQGKIHVLVLWRLWDVKQFGKRSGILWFG